MIQNNRRHDIDWLRVIAIGLLLIYHVTIAFQPWGVFIGFIQSDTPMEWIWWPMSLLNVWRIPLLFFVSGMGVYFAIQRRDWKKLLLERSKRILLPFIFGMLAIVPLHLFLWQSYYQQDLSYFPNPSHLWFLGNIFIYVLLFCPLFFYLKRNSSGEIRQVLSRLLANPFGLLVLVIPFIIESELIQPESFELYAMTPHGFWIGMIAFVTGFLCVYSGAPFWNTVTKWRFLLSTLALTLFVIRIIEFDLKSPHYLAAIESVLWIFTVFGFGHTHLNRPSKTLNYLSEAAYPIYIVHMFFLFLGSFLIFPLDIDVSIALVLVLGITFSGSFIFYELCIRRIKIIRPFFGLKN